MADNKPQKVTAASVPELYADRVPALTVRGNVARMALASERPEAGDGQVQTVLVGHLAMPLPLPGFLQLYTQMRNVVRQMEERGLINGVLNADSASEKPKKSTASSRTKRSGGSTGRAKKS